MIKVIFLAILYYPFLQASIGVVALKKGDVSLINNNKIYQLKKGLTVNNNDTIETKDSSFVKIIFNDNSMLDIDENSMIKISFISKDKEKKSVLNFLYGKIKSIVGKRESENSYEIKSGATSWGIRGTELDIKKEKNNKGFVINIWSGSVDLNLPNKKIYTLLQGQEYNLSSSGDLDIRQMTSEEISENIARKNSNFTSPSVILSKASKDEISAVIRVFNKDNSKEFSSQEVILDNDVIENISYPYSIKVNQNDISIATKINEL